MLLHGWGMNGGVWDEVAASLGAGSSVSTPDLPGYGAAPPAAAGLSALVTWLRGSAPDDGVWVGWSLGATVVLAAAACSGSGPCPRAVVLVSATPRFTAGNGWPHGVSASGLAEFRDALSADYAGTLRRFLLMQSGGAPAARASARRLAAACAARGAPGPAVLDDGLAVLATTDLRGELSRVAMPVTVVHGTRDVVVPPAAGRWLAEHLPRARLVEIPAAGHAPFLDAPEAFAALVGRQCREADLQY